ncbi:MAG: protein kinase [Deltaproteobacteria bacterium]|nr:protein kinase [Deltaproteobacteria bacterium]
MATCPTCLVRYPDEATSCESDGSALVPDGVVAALDRDVAAGETIGDYRVESKLGQGGFGAVYRAVHPLIGKRVAIKVLSRKLCGDAEMLSRFVSEARVVNDIQSRNIVDIFGYGALPDGRQFYVMELLDGMSLDALVAQRQRLTVSEAMPIFRGSPGRSTRRMGRGSSTAISSPRTCSSSATTRGG